MKRTSAELKRISRGVLGGHWGFIIGLTVLTGLMAYVVGLPFYAMLSISDYAIPQLVSYFIATIIIALLSQVLQCGIIRVQLGFARKEQTRLGMLFGEFSNRPDRYILGMLLLLGIELGSLVPGYVILILGIFMDSIFMIILGGLAVIGGAVVSMILLLRYAVIFLLLVDNPHMKMLEAFKESSRLMHGNKGRLFYINLSFLGLCLLSILSCGIGMLWITPYMAQTNVSFYQEITGELDKKAEPDSKMEQNSDTASFGDYTV